jgi:putative transposase
VELACCRYVELKPLHAGMVDNPSKYRGASCQTKVGLTKPPWLDSDPFYLSLGKSTAKRAEKYAARLSETIPESELRLIRETPQRGQLTANEKFVRKISEKLGRRLEIRGPGRPRKKE